MGPVTADRTWQIIADVSGNVQEHEEIEPCLSFPVCGPYHEILLAPTWAFPTSITKRTIGAKGLIHFFLLSFRFVFAFHYFLISAIVCLFS
jgi:hypothetical protein